MWPADSSTSFSNVYDLSCLTVFVLLISRGKMKRTELVWRRDIQWSCKALRPKGRDKTRNLDIQLFGKMDVTLIFQRPLLKFSWADSPTSAHRTHALFCAKCI